MPIKLDVIGKKSRPHILNYNWRDCSLYALSIGATGTDIKFVYEKARGGMKVIPSFAIVAFTRPFFDVQEKCGVKLSSILHLRQTIKWLKVIPSKGKFITTASLREVYDKKKNAVLIIDYETKDQSGELLFLSTGSYLSIGEGGFGGSPTPDIVRHEPPKGRRPAFEVNIKIPKNQATLYRLTGDYNPIHIDPVAARQANLKRPILHGSCIYGYMIRLALKELFDNDVTKFIESSVGFANVLYPGEFLIVRGWETGDQLTYVLNAETKDRVVLDNSYIKAKS